MKHISAEQALSFVKALELPARGGYDSLLGDKSLEPIEYGFDTAKNQAMVVGSDIVSLLDNRDHLTHLY